MRCLVLAVVLSIAAHASAQTRFAEAEARAVDVEESRFADSVAAVLADCTNAASASARRACVTARRRAGRDALRATYLVEMPADTYVRFGSYESANEGFRIYVRGFVFRRTGAPGVLATASTLGGLLPRAHIAKVGFVRVAEADAAVWLRAHSPSDLSLRAIVRLGDDFDDSAAPAPNDRYGVRLEVLGVQIYGNSTGDVLFDSYAAAVPQAPSRLEERTRLYGRDEHREGVFVANDGVEVVLDATLAPRAEGAANETAILVQTVGALRSEILRTAAPCCSASIDVSRHGSTKLLAIVTEEAPTTGSAGRGRVVLLVWNRASLTFEQRAEWVGTNGSAPPAWVLDPNVDP